jgi:acyl-CoA synthetase (AMP-forming)/AMP-acid ligase II/acyl carrier protein
LAHASSPQIAPSDLPFATVPDGFRAAVAHAPERIAYRDTERSITYGELDRASNVAARHLLGLGETRPLVLIAPVRIDSLVLILGALKSGRLVAPLDPRWPVEQWVEVVRRVDGHLAVPDDATRASLPDPLAGRALVTSRLLRDGNSSPVDVDLDPDAPAFVFFTSGSTGAPKGTLVGHGMPMRALDLLEGIEPHDRVALLAPLSFITGTMGAIGTVLAGISGHFFDVTTQDVATLPSWLAEHEITVMGLSVTMIGMMARALIAEGRTVDSVRFVGHGGEAGSARHFADTRRAFPNSQSFHSYGQTEAGQVARYIVGSTIEPPDAPVPVGHPLPWVEVTIVDELGAPVPDGELGEILVTGRQVAFGYWNEPALTAERFDVHPDGRRTVHTGDRGRFRPDGMLEIAGRVDRRVKVHGQLVDLSQVEHEVKQLTGVRDAVVSAVPTDDGAHRVVAHVVVEAGHQTTVGALRRELAPRVPPYAIPRAFFRVDDIPQTNSGKVDRVWLRETTVGALPLDTEYVEPRDARELAVAHLFEEVLAVERVGVHDDFFELGGDSLSAVDLLAGLHEELGLDLSPGELLAGATVEAIARRLDHVRHARPQTVVLVNDAVGPSLFCVPGAADTPLQFRFLGRRLPDLAVHAFAYRGMDARAIPDQSVAAIARRNVAALRPVDPRGPHRLLGYSFGGAVALEMARQLTAAGEPVEVLVLLEPSFAPPGDRSRFEQSRAFAGRVHGAPSARTRGTTSRRGSSAAATSRTPPRRTPVASSTWRALV